MKQHTRIDSKCDICGKIFEGQHRKRITYSTMKIACSGFLDPMGGWFYHLNIKREVCEDCLKSFIENFSEWERKREEAEKNNEKRII